MITVFAAFFFETGDEIMGVLGGVSAGCAGPAGRHAREAW
jgi:hypothetical protein